MRLLAPAEGGRVRQSRPWPCSPITAWRSGPAIPLRTGERDSSHNRAGRTGTAAEHRSQLVRAPRDRHARQPDRPARARRFGEAHRGLGDARVHDASGQRPARRSAKSSRRRSCIHCGRALNPTLKAIVQSDADVQKRDRGVRPAQSRKSDRRSSRTRLPPRSCRARAWRAARTFSCTRRRLGARTAPGARTALGARTAPPRPEPQPTAPADSGPQTRSRRQPSLRPPPGRRPHQRPQRRSRPPPECRPR